MELQIQILFIFGKKEIQCIVDRTRFKTFYNFEKKNANSLCTLVNEFVSKENNLNKIIKKYKFPKKLVFYQLILIQMI